MFDNFLFPILTGAASVFITWIVARRKNNAEAKGAEIETEIKAADFYKNLIDDAKKRLDEAIATIEEQNKRLRDRDVRIEEQDRKITQLTDEVEKLIEELKKYKQLSHKSEK